jgi:hypothetical protein
MRILPNSFAALGLALLAVFAVGCITTIEPRPLLPPTGEPFPHAELDRVQQRFVDERGRVDYPALAADRGDLDTYYRRLAAVSPHSHPERFPRPVDEITYWINAYNASALVAVLEAWPIDSIGDIRPPLVLRPVLWGRSAMAGFFFFRKVVLGGETISLLDLENEVIRPYGDPRIHFAINCASIGCPRLPRRAFSADGLDAELDRETRRFFADPEKLRIDPDARTVHLSSILDWFEGDFTGWLEQQGAGESPTLLDYVRRYVSAERKTELDRAQDYDVSFIEYDWGLNAQ